MAKRVDAHGLAVILDDEVFALEVGNRTFFICNQDVNVHLSDTCFEGGGGLLSNFFASTAGDQTK